MKKTLAQYDAASASCREVFLQKTADYGTAWRILRPASLTDQLMIKARRVRTIQETGAQRIADSIRSEFVGLLNYALLALIQLRLQDDTMDTRLELTLEEASQLYDTALQQVRELMIEKNTDYGEAWRDMRISSLTDLILMKILRLKQIEDNQGQTLVSEGLEANYQDIANYALFALIKIDEKDAKA